MPFSNLKYNQAICKDDAKVFSVDKTSKDCPKLSVVDQLDAQPFMRGENGFNRNIISQIMAVESMELKQMLLAKLGDLSKANGFDPDTPARKIIDTIMPKYVQTAASTRDWLSDHDESIGKYVDGLKAEYDRQQKILHLDLVPSPSSTTVTADPE